MGFAGKVVTNVKNDANFSRLGRGVVKGVHGIRSGGGTYFAKKVPIAQWIPEYKPKWIIGDVISGLSVGLVLIPQAVLLAAVAGVPIQSALIAGWMSGIIYAIMGTSRDISVGPTTTTATFTATVVAGLAQRNVPAVFACGALSFCVGLWSIIFGVLNLGFIFSMISLPMALGFLFATGIVTQTSQFPLILGEVGVTPVFHQLLPEVIKKIKDTKPISVAIAAASIVLLAMLSFVGRKWGLKREWLRILTTTRHIFVIVVFTGISFIFNHGLETPLWAILGPIKTPITTTFLTTSVPLLQFQIVQAIILPSLLLFMFISIEHTSTAKAFAHTHSYVPPNQSQELFSLGVINLVQSVFGALPVSGGDLTRSSIISTANGNSPLLGLFTSGLVIISFSFLSPIFQYLPMPTIAAVIFVAVTEKMPPHSTFKKYWKISFVDFLQFILVLNGTLGTIAAGGIGGAIVFMVFYTLLRVMFSRPKTVLSADLEYLNIRDSAAWWATENERDIPPGTRVIRLETDVVWLNAERMRRHVVDTILLHHSGMPSLAHKDRAWNDLMEKRVELVRRRGGGRGAATSSKNRLLPFLTVLILDLSRTSFIDASAIQAFLDLKAQIKNYAGRDVEIRFVGLNDNVRWRFERAGWKLTSPYEDEEEAGSVFSFEDDKEKLVDDEMGVSGSELVFDCLKHAITYRRMEQKATSGGGRMAQSRSFEEVYGIKEEARLRVSEVEMYGIAR